mmetsp:Transcript_91429/g.261144  ORF Transcript_91429/g.261144 Transcript_91429/m.261144 type:complete len:1348 (-) Transcript_91429:433-4476(-)
MMMQVQQQARRSTMNASLKDNNFTSFNRDEEESSEEEEGESGSEDSMGIIEGEDSDVDDGESASGDEGSVDSEQSGSISDDGEGSDEGSDEDSSESDETENDRLNPRSRSARRRQRRREREGGRSDSDTDLQEEDDRRSMRRLSNHNVDSTDVAVAPQRDGRYHSRSSEIKADDWGARRLANPKTKVTDVIAQEQTENPETKHKSRNTHVNEALNALRKSMVGPNSSLTASEPGGDKSAKSAGGAADPPTRRRASAFLNPGNPGDPRALAQPVPGRETPKGFSPPPQAAQRRMSNTTHYRGANRLSHGPSIAFSGQSVAHSGGVGSSGSVEASQSNAQDRTDSAELGGAGGGGGGEEDDHGGVTKSGTRRRTSLLKGGIHLPHLPHMPHLPQIAKRKSSIAPSQEGANADAAALVASAASMSVSGNVVRSLIKKESNAPSSRETEKRVHNYPIKHYASPEEKKKISKMMGQMMGKMIGTNTRAQRHWRKLRGTVKAVWIFKNISRDHKMYGAAAHDDHIDWSEFNQIDYSGRPWYILMPNDSFRQNWDMSMAIVLLTIAFYVPYTVCFVEQDFNWNNIRGWQWYDLFTTFVFTVDIFLNFLTGYQLDTPDRRIETRMAPIACNYMRGWFWFDFIATTPFDMLVAEGGIASMAKLSRLPRLFKILRIMKLLRLLRVYKLQVYIMQIEATYRIHEGVTRLFNICFLVLVVTHCVACAWFSIGKTDAPLECEDIGKYHGDIPVYDDADWNELNLEQICSWIYRYEYHRGTMQKQYIAALYWSFSTLTTVGYGDISAKTMGEQVFSMVMMLLGVSWYAYVVSSMSSIIASFDLANRKVQQKLLAVNSFIRDNQLEGQLATRVRYYFQHAYSTQNRWMMLNSYDSSEIFRELSSDLRSEVICYIERGIAEKIPFLDNKSTKFKADFILLLEPAAIHKGENIITKGTKADAMYFLLSGRATVVNDKGVRVKSFVEGSFFGEVGCMLGGVRSADVVAASTCQLQVLSKKALADLMAEYPEVLEELKSTVKRRMAQGQEPKREGLEKVSTSTIKKDAPVAKAADKKHGHGHGGAKRPSQTHGGSGKSPMAHGRSSIAHGRASMAHGRASMRKSVVGGGGLPRRTMHRSSSNGGGGGRRGRHSKVEKMADVSETGSPHFAPPRQVVVNKRGSFDESAAILAAQQKWESPGATEVVSGGGGGQPSTSASASAHASSEANATSRPRIPSQASSDGPPGESDSDVGVDLDIIPQIQRGASAPAGGLLNAGPPSPDFDFKIKGRAEILSELHTVETTMHHVEELEEDVIKRVSRLEAAFDEQKKYLESTMNDLTTILKTLQPKEANLRSNIHQFQSQPSM